MCAERLNPKVCQTRDPPDKDGNIGQCKDTPTLISPTCPAQNTGPSTPACQALITKLCGDKPTPQCVKETDELPQCTSI